MGKPLLDGVKIKRIILKISGEALAGDDFAISHETLRRLAQDVKVLRDNAIQVGIVVGGGNFLRGGKITQRGFSRLTGDHLGMLATVMNALAIVDVFAQNGIAARAVSALGVDSIIERYIPTQASVYLDAGKVVVFAAGTGNPFVTTDTALCLRGIELQADLLLKATNVDGVYSADPRQNSDAKLYTHLTYQEVLAKKLAVMDQAAFCLGCEHDMRLVVFNINKAGAMVRAVQGLEEGTLVTN